MEICSYVALMKQVSFVGCFEFFREVVDCRKRRRIVVMIYREITANGMG